jgi:hypothetical protein
LRRERGIFRHAFILFDVFNDFLETVMIHAEHNVTVHLDKAAITVPGKAGVTRLRGKPFHGHVVEAQVEHGIHHSGHGYACARADRDQQGIMFIAELATDGSLDMGQPLAHLFDKAIGVAPIVRIKCGAYFGGDGEAGGDGQANRGHFRKVCSFAPKQVSHLRLAFVTAGAEAINPFAHAEILLTFDPREISETVHSIPDAGEKFQAIVA